MAIAAESWFTAAGTATVAFSFVQTEGVPAPVVREFREVRRTGVNNLGHYLGGLVGEQFDLKTWVDVANIGTAKALQVSYRAAEGGVLDLYWQAALVGTCFVYKVSPQPVEILASSVGGFNNGLAVCPAVWRLRGLA